MYKPIVSVGWLHQNLDAHNLVILDATIPKVTEGNSSSYSESQIPNAIFFDIKNKFSDTSAEFPNTIPSEDQFTKEAQALGINMDSAIVVYDEKGIYSSARVWWLFKTFGHNNVSVLNGGLPEWLKSDFEVEPKQNSETQKGNFVANYRPNYIKNFESICAISKERSTAILDARSKDRFNGVTPEPREGLRSGTIPNSKNLPYTELLTDNKLKPETDLKHIFDTLVETDKKIVFSCGSGITACILALAAEVVGYRDVSVYDGSWTEYGSLTN